MSDDLAQEEERSVMLSCSRKGKQQVPGVVWGVSPVLLELLREGLSRAPHARPEHSHGLSTHTALRGMWVDVTHSSKSLRPECMASLYQLDQFN